MALWEYIHGFAGVGKPDALTFYDHQDEALYRDVQLRTIGQHGWELVTVILNKDPETGEARYEYFFKRDRHQGYEAGFGRSSDN